MKKNVLENRFHHLLMHFYSIRIKDNTFTNSKDYFTFKVISFATTVKF